MESPEFYLVVESSEFYLVVEPQRILYYTVTMCEKNGRNAYRNSSFFHTYQVK